MITQDCYADVSGWTDEEVQQAAEIFKDAVDGSVIDDLEVRLKDDYRYLMFLGDEESVFVGNLIDVHAHNRETQLTKEEVFHMDNSQDDKEMTFEYSLNDGISWFKCEILFEGSVGYVIRGWPEGAPDEGFEMYLEKDEVMFRETKTQAEKEIEEMNTYLTKWWYLKGDNLSVTLPEYLHNQGYRKVK